jgi:hypothetical protein
MSQAQIQASLPNLKAKELMSSITSLISMASRSPLWQLT